MTAKKRSVSFSINIQTWDRCLKLKGRLPFNWSDVVDEALIKVLEPLEMAFNQLESGVLPQELLSDLSALNRTHYLDTESIISEHLPTQSKVPSRSRSQVSKK
jgi:hypothetical protein